MNMTGKDDSNSNEYLKLAAEHLVACIDEIETTSIEIYENYRSLVDSFRGEIKELTRQSWWMNADYHGLEAETRKQLGYAITKACQLRVILPEKYQSVGEQLTHGFGRNENEEKERLV